MQLPTRYRTPILALTAVVLGLVVVGAILLVGRIGAPEASSGPTSSAPAPSATDSLSTPEGAVRAFFEAFGAARRTDDPSLLSGLVTSTGSSAYLTAAGFLEGQKAVGTASLLTVNEISDVVVIVDGTRATVTFRHHQAGYDIDIKTGQPKESPTALPDVTVRVVVMQSGGHWLVDAFENLP